MCTHISSVVLISNLSGDDQYVGLRLAYEMLVEGVHSKRSCILAFFLKKISRWT